MKIIMILLAMFILNINSSCAISINPNGTGEVIIVPYFTAHNDLNTYVTVSNTTDVIKAVKVKFNDGIMDIPVMNFNLYLFPWETFAFTVAPLSSNYGGRSDGAIFFDESSCVTPISSGERFTRVPPLSGHSLNTTEGSIQIFEMGEILQGATTCNEFKSLWDEGTWFDNPSLYVTQPTGGIKSTASIIDVANGSQFSFEPTAFVDFYPSNVSETKHTKPNSGRPSLRDANSIVNGYIYESGAHALSSVIAKSQVINQFNIEAGVAAQTEWVLTFPTKNSLNRTTTCFKASHGFVFDRKGNGRQISTGLDDYCNIINVMKFGDSDGRSILDSFYQTEFSLPNDPMIIHGQLNINFADAEDPDRFYIEAQSISDNEPGNLKVYGVPVLGFAIEKLYNANAQPGLLATYTTSYQHTL